MPLDDLVSVIEALKARIRDHRADLQANETRTRMALIDPLLTALGWDAGDPALVSAEYDLKGSRADYALLGANGKPASFVEAKKLGESLAAHRMQMVNYANMAGVAYAGLTDGDRWEMYTVFDQRPIEDRRIVEVSIAQKPAYESALQLLRLWRPNMASGKPVPAGEPIFAKVTQAPPDDAVPDKPARRRIPAAPNAPSGVSLASYDPQNAHASKPPAIRFPDGIARNTRYWWQLPVFAAEWLWSNGQLTKDKIPVGMSNKSYFINTEAVHPSGKSFHAPQAISGTPLVFDKHGNRNAMVDRAKRLLEHCGVNPAEVRLKG